MKKINPPDTNTFPFPPVPRDLAGWRWERTGDGIRLFWPQEGYNTPPAPANSAGVDQAIAHARIIAQDEAAAIADIAAKESAAMPRRRGPALRLSTSGAVADASTHTLIALELIDDNPYQPRLAYDDARIVAIAGSIREHGLLQIPVARQVGPRYQLAFGHTRLRAFRHLAASDQKGWATMPIMVRALDDETMALHAWTENKDRKDLTAFEEATAIERYTTAFGWTQTQVAAKLGLDRATVSNKLRLLRLPQQSLDQLRQGHISERQAAALLPLLELPDDIRGQVEDCQVYVGPQPQRLRAMLSDPSSVDSPTLRRAIDQAIRHTTHDLDGLAWSKADAIGVGSVRAVSCTHCSLRLKSNRCTDKACFDAKTAWWAQHLARSAAASVGLPALVVPTPWSGYDILRDVDLAKLRSHAEASGCGNLGVVHFEKTYFKYIEVEGHAGCCIVCVHGDGKRCTCKAALDRGNDPAASAKAHDRQERNIIKATLKEPAEAVVAAALVGPTVAIWKFILQKMNHNAKVKSDALLADVHAALAAELVTQAIKYELAGGKPDIAVAQRKLEQLFADLALTAPWARQPANGLIATMREHLTHAREFAGFAMANFEIKSAWAVYAQILEVVQDNDRLAALACEIYQAADEIAAQDVCTQTPAAAPPPS